MQFRTQDRVALVEFGLHFGPEILGTITEVHEVPDHPELNEYSVEWDDGLYPDEVWSNEDLREPSA